ncbi:hypothetical protein, partial [Methylomagnum sp.]
EQNWLSTIGHPRKSLVEQIPPNFVLGGTPKATDGAAYSVLLHLFHQNKQPPNGFLRSRCKPRLARLLAISRKTHFAPLGKLGGTPRAIPTPSTKRDKNP